jgi:hypothetical protein
LGKAATPPVTATIFRQNGKEIMALLAPIAVNLWTRVL